MARGIILCRWDDRLGVVLEAKFPLNVAESLGDDDLLTIFSTHAISEKAGVMAMRIKRVNIISYYSGLPEGERTSQFVIALILEPDENPSPYEEGLVEISKMLIPAVGKPKFDEFFAESFDRISKYMSISEEQRFSFIFRDNTRRLLLERLANGPMTKEGLAKWLSKEIGEEITDIEGLLAPLRKTELIEEMNISKGKKVNLEYVFLIRDVAVIRTPHVALYKAAKEGQMAGDLRDKYLDNVNKFFKEYRITAQDTIIIANLISDPDRYEIIRLLRKEYCTRAEIPTKIGREIVNLDKILKQMAEDHIITAIKDSKERIWLLLMSDIVFPEFFPEYMVDVIRRRWREGTIQKEIALKHLELLRAQYIGTQAPKFRKKILETIATIFANADRAVKKKQWDQGGNMVEQIANYFRDMGVRKVGEAVDAMAKGIREDKEKYVEQNWEQDRVKILEAIKDVEESDKAKIAAQKAGKKKGKAKPAPKKKDTKQTKKDEKAPSEQPENESHKISTEDENALAQPAAVPQTNVTARPTPPPAYNPPPAAPKSSLSPPPSAPSSAPPSAPPTEEAPPAAPSAPVGDIKTQIAQLKEKIKQLSKTGSTLDVAEAINNLADLYAQNGDKDNADKLRKKAMELGVQGLQESEKELVEKAKAAMKKKDFAGAVSLYEELIEISNQLFKNGLMQYAEMAKKYQKAKSEAESK